MMIRVVLAFLGYLHACSAIIGGEPDPSTQLAVRIYNGKRKPSCYGALVSPRHVVTAIACNDVEPFSTSVQLGPDIIMDVISTIKLGNGMQALELISDVNLTDTSITSVSFADQDFEEHLKFPGTCKFYSYGPTSRKESSRSYDANSLEVRIKNFHNCWVRDSNELSYSQFDACVKLPKRTGLCAKNEIGAPLICETYGSDRVRYGRYVLYGVYSGRANFKRNQKCKARYLAAPRASAVHEYSFSLVGREVGQTCGETAQCLHQYTVCSKDYQLNEKHCRCICPGQNSSTSCSQSCLLDFNTRYKVMRPFYDGFMFDIWNITAGGEFLQLSIGESPSMGTLEKVSPDETKYLYFESSDAGINDYSILETTVLIESDMCFSFEYNSFSRYSDKHGNFTLTISAPDGTIFTQDLNTTQYGVDWQTFAKLVPENFLFKETTFKFIMFDRDSYRSDHGLENLFLRYSHPNQTCVLE